jgi:uncharacterized protein with FMN-binding domain
VKRAPIVITATVVGLIGVLEFHTKPSTVGIGSIPAAGAASAGSAATAPPRGSAASAAPSSGSSGSAAGPRPASTSGRAAAKSAAAQAPATRTAAGPAVNYSYGVLAVSVTVSGTKITKVGIASLDDGGNPRSQYIDEQSIPMLEQQAMQAQRANIQGVSGASYTSAGFHQSLQGALQKLGLG